MRSIISSKVNKGFDTKVYAKHMLTFVCPNFAADYDYVGTLGLDNLDIALTAGEPEKYGRLRC